MSSASKLKTNTDAAKPLPSNAMNSLKHGMYSQAWIDPSEQQQYDELCSELKQEYASYSPTIMVQIERMATTIVKMRRLQKIENALYRKAQATAISHAQEKIRLGVDQATDEANKPSPELALQIAGDAALPDLMRLDTLARYQSSLDRQLSKVIGEIQILQNALKANSSKGVTISEI